MDLMTYLSSLNDPEQFGTALIVAGVLFVLAVAEIFITATVGRIFVRKFPGFSAVAGISLFVLILCTVPTAVFGAI